MKKILTAALAALALTLSLAGCCMSEEAKAAQALFDALPDSYSEGLEEDMELAMQAYEALTDEDKEDVDPSAYDTLQQDMVTYYTAGINEKIDALDVKVASVKDANAAYNAISDIMDEIGDMPLSMDEHIHYTHLSDQLSIVSDRFFGVSVDFVTDAAALKEAMSLCTTIQNTSRTSTAYGYCTDIETQMNKMTDNVAAAKIGAVNKVCNELQDDLLYDEFGAIMTKVDLYQAVIDLSDAVLEFYEPWTDDIDPKLNNILAWEELIAERDPNAA